MAFCVKCGRPLNEGTIVCPFCGTVVGQQRRGGNKNQTILYVIIAFLFLVLIGVVCYYFIAQNNAKNERMIAEMKQRQDALERKNETSSQTNAEKSAAPAPKKIYTIEGIHQLSGSISKYGITMDIEVRRGYVNGTYYYHSQGSSNRMTVSGTISGNTMSLEEYAPSGENTGYFEGVFNGLSYNGTFHNYSKGSTMNFSLTDR